MAATNLISTRDGTLSPETTEVLVSLLLSKDKGLSLGPYFLGDVFFCGIVIAQFIIWHGYELPERLFTKVVVYCLVFVSVGYSIWIVVFSMRLFVYNFGYYATFVDITWIQFCAIGEVMVALLAQAFYAERVYRLLKNSKLVFAVIAFAMLLEIGSAIWSICVAQSLKSILEAKKVTPSVGLNLAAQLLADFIITGLTAYALYKSKTGKGRTDRLIDGLVKYTFEIQLPPTLWVLISTIFWSANQVSTIVVFMNLFMSKPYTMSVLAVLNARSKIRNQMLPGNDRNNSTTPSGALGSNGLEIKAVSECYLYEHSATYHAPEPLASSIPQDFKRSVNEESTLEND